METTLTWHRALFGFFVLLGLVVLLVLPAGALSVSYAVALVAITAITVLATGVTRFKLVALGVLVAVVVICAVAAA